MSVQGRYVEFAGKGSSPSRSAGQRSGPDRSLSGFSGHSRCPTLKDRFRKPPTFTRQDRVTLTSLKLAVRPVPLVPGESEWAHAETRAATSKA